MARLNLTDEETQELYKQWREYHGEPEDEGGEPYCPDIPPAAIRAFQWGIAYQKKLNEKATGKKDTYSTRPPHSE